VWKSNWGSKEGVEKMKVNSYLTIFDELLSRLLAKLAL